MDNIKALEAENALLRAQLPGRSAESSTNHVDAASEIDLLIAEMVETTATTNTAHPAQEPSRQARSNVYTSSSSWSSAPNDTQIPQAANLPQWDAVTHAPPVHPDYIRTSCGICMRRAR